LKDQIDRRRALDCCKRGRNMGQHAALTRQLEPLEKVGQLNIFCEGVGRRVDADDGVAST